MIVKQAYLILRGVISAFLIFLFSAHGFAQQEGKYDLFFQSGKVTPDVASSKSRFKSGAVKFSERVYKIVQFNDIPTDQQKSMLQGRGIHLLQYIPNYAFYVSIESGTEISSSILDQLGIRALLDVSPFYKIKPELLGQEMPAGAVVEPGTVDVVISLFENVSLTDAKLKLSGFGAFQTSDSDELVLRVSPDKIISIASIGFVSYVAPVFYESLPENYTGRTDHRGNVLDAIYPGGLKFNGTGVTVSVGDGGLVEQHIDFKGRLTAKQTSEVSSHGTHVAGIVGGAGVIDPKMKGQAMGASILTYTQYADISNIATIYNTDGVRITSHSLGSDCMGSYDANTRTADAQARQYNSLFHVYSAGNSGTANCNQYPAGWGNITGGRKQGKNGIAVGNLSRLDVLSGSSSRGPASDGRIKPDICAVGSSVQSTDLNNTYTSKSGTSMACPGVSGVLAQLIQAYRAKNGGADPKTGLLKGILLNSADDLGNEGPDFKHGFGRVNALSAYNCFNQNRFQTGTVSNGQTRTHTINVPANTARMKVMIYWTDYEATAGTSKALVNDLDCVVKSGATTFLPYILNPSTTSTSALDAPATRGTDHTNNVEQIVIDNPSGSYTVEVRGYLVPQGPQEYFVVYEFLNDNITVTYPIGGEGFVSGETEVVRWDTYGNTGTFTLEYSTNGGSSWTTVSSSISGARRYYEWTVPSTVTGRAQVRVSRGGKSDRSDANFSIIGVPANLKVDWICTNSYQVSWSAVTGAESYTVYQLGDKYMDSIGTTTSLNFNLPTSSGKTEYYSVNANIAGVKGRRAIARTKSGSPFGCQSTTDLAVTLISSPANNACLTSGSQADVVVRVENKGTTTVSSYTLSYSVNGGTAVTNTISTPLAAGQTYNHTFTQKLTVPSNASNTLVATVTASGDATSGNNSISTNFITPVTPAITIQQTSASPSCPGTAVSFTATVTNGGTSPAYQWRVNGTNAGTGSSYSSSTLQNGAVVTCVLTSNASCISSTSATSNSITVQRQNGEQHQFYIATRSLNPSMTWQIRSGSTVVLNSSAVTRTTSGSNTVQDFCLASGCYDLVVTNAFQAGGCSAPAWNSTTVYQGDAALGAGKGMVVSYNGRQYRAQWWTQGDIPGSGGNNPWLDLGVCTTSYPTDVYGLKNLTTPATHVEVQQQNYSSPRTNNFCYGSTVNFTANTTTPTNCQNVTFTANTTGTITSYLWNFGVGATPATATTAGPHTVSYSTTGQKTVSLTVNGSTTETKTNYINVSQNTSIVPAITIAASSSTICSGTSVNFTISNQQHQGTSPGYSWRVNGTQEGTGTSFSSASLANNDKVTVVLTSNAACATTTTATSNVITMAVTSSVTPGVTVSANQTTICSGTSVTFNAAPTNGGSAPAYQWRKNGTNISGATSATYSTNNIANNDVFSVVLTSNASCASASTATSNNVAIAVTGSVSPGVTVSANQTTICSGTSVTFNAAPTNGGTAPAYQWRKNGTNISGAISATYTTSNIANNDVFSVVLTSNASCASPLTATSNNVAITITGSVSPGVTASANQTTVCSGTSVTFTAAPTNGGTAPAYQWRKNGMNISGATSATYTTSNVADNDVFSVELTSNATCASASAAISNNVVVTVHSVVVPTISVNASSTNITSGTSVTFTTTASPGTIQWKLNGLNVGTGTMTYTSTNLQNGDKVTAVLTSDAVCANPSVITSNEITMTVTPLVNTISCADVSTWNMNAIYVQGDRCERNGIKYEAKWWTRGEDPVIRSGQWDVWNKLGECTSGTYGSPVQALKTNPSSDTSIVENTTITVRVSSEQVLTNAVYYLYKGDELIIAIDGLGPFFVADWKAVVTGDFWLQVVARDANNTKVYSDAIQLGVQKVTAVSHSGIIGALEVIPNPNMGSFSLAQKDIVANLQGAKLTVTDMYGHEVYYGVLNSASEIINVESLKAGMYVVKAEKEGKLYLSKFVIN